MEEEQVSEGPKITITEAILIGSALGILDIIDIIPLAGDITDIAAAPLLFYYNSKGINGIAYGISLGLDLIPGLQEFPTRTIVWIATVLIDHFAPASVTQIAEKAGELAQGGEGVAAGGAGAAGAVEGTAAEGAAAQSAAGGVAGAAEAEGGVVGTAESAAAGEKAEAGAEGAGKAGGKEGDYIPEAERDPIDVERGKMFSPDGVGTASAESDDDEDDDDVDSEPPAANDERVRYIQDIRAKTERVKIKPKDDPGNNIDLPNAA
jgi:hypothetical protein